MSRYVSHTYGWQPLTRVEAMRRECGSTPTSPWRVGGPRQRRAGGPRRHPVLPMHLLVHHQGTTPSRAPTLGDLGLCTVQPHQHTLAVTHIAPSYSRVQGKVVGALSVLPYHNRSWTHGESDGDLSVRSPGYSCFLPYYNPDMGRVYY